MGRSRYVITVPAQPHFLTCTVMEWLPLFSRPALVDILLDCWRYQQARQGLRLYGYVVMENHLHYLAQSPDLAQCVSSFRRGSLHLLGGKSLREFSTLRRMTLRAEVNAVHAGPGAAHRLRRA